MPETAGVHWKTCSGEAPEFPHVPASVLVPLVAPLNLPISAGITVAPSHAEPGTVVVVVVLAGVVVVVLAGVVTVVVDGVEVVVVDGAGVVLVVVTAMVVVVVLGVGTVVVVEAVGGVTRGRK